jgi:hypothetical protein
VSDEVTLTEKTAQRGEGAGLRNEERPLDAWARCAPIRLAGYEEDPWETHILRSID